MGRLLRSPLHGTPQSTMMAGPDAPSCPPEVEAASARLCDLPDDVLGAVLERAGMSEG